MRWRTASCMSYVVPFLAMLIRSESHAHRTNRIPSLHHTHGDRTATLHGDKSLLRQRMLVTSKFPYMTQQPVSPVLSMRGGARFPMNVVSYIKSSKSRCWALLVFSIMIEAAATTINKRAADTKSAQLFMSSCILFLIWYVRAS